MLTENDVRKTLEYTKRNCGLPNGQGNTWSPNRETKAIDAALKAMDELEAFKELGSYEELKALKEDMWEALEALKMYSAIGTVEECKNAVEKMTPKKPARQTKALDHGMYVGDIGRCPTCESIVSEDNDCCDRCHQILDWAGERMGNGARIQEVASKNEEWILISSGARPAQGQLCWITRRGEQVADLVQYSVSRSDNEYWFDEERDGEEYDTEDIIAWLPYVVPDAYCDHD